MFWKKLVSNVCNRFCFNCILTRLHPLTKHLLTMTFFCRLWYR